MLNSSGKVSKFRSKQEVQSTEFSSIKQLLLSQLLSLFILWTLPSVTPPFTIFGLKYAKIN